MMSCFGEGNSNTAKYWQYDSRLGRRWNVDPIIKEYESPYLAYGGNPVLIIDPTGGDSIFYNSSGKEIGRTIIKGDHTYWLKDSQGNFSIGGENYYNGNSYYSFFGDPDRFKEKPSKFSEIDSRWAYLDPFTFSRQVKGIVNANYNGTAGETYIPSFLYVHSAPGEKFDYKNNVLFNPSKDLGSPDNISTAYMIGATLYNRNEMGMIFWGATTAAAGMNLWVFSKFNEAAHQYLEGNGDEMNEVNAWKLGRSLYQSHFSTTGWDFTFPNYNYEATWAVPSSGNSLIDAGIIILGAYPELFKKTQGVDPTNSNGIYYDNWDEIRQ